MIQGYPDGVLHIVNHKGAYKREAGGSEARGGGVTKETEVGVMSWRLENATYAARFGDGEGATSQGMLVASRSWKRQEKDSPSEPPEGSQLWDTLTLVL